MNNFTSQKFRFYSFLSMFLLVFVHGYNLHDTYLQPFSIVKEHLTITTFTEYFLANGLFRFRIPMLFIISGYLFSLNDQKPYLQRIKKRARTLLIPYLIWSAVALFITFLWQQFPVTAQAVTNAGIDQLGDNRVYTLIGWKGMLTRWTLAPIAFQLWFIRCLFVYNLLYPLLLKAVLKIPKIWFPIVIFLWLVTAGFHFVEGEGLLFFTLGIWICKRNFNIEKTPSFINIKWMAFLFIASCIIKTILAFYFDYNLTSFIILSLLHKTAVFTGLVTMWYGADGLVKFFMQRRNGLNGYQRLHL
jgi:fucose 4-O-acetylase-like acetyltransferase